LIFPLPSQAHFLGRFSWYISRKSLIAGGMAIFAPIVTGAADDTFIVAIASEATAAIAIANFEALIIIRPLVVSVLRFCYATITLRTVTAGATEIGRSVTPGKLPQGSTRYSRRPPAYEPGLGRYAVSCGVVDAD
jgi:hypothetical protein